MPSDNIICCDETMSKNKIKYSVGGCCCCIALLLICIFTFGGIRFVAFDEYAIAYYGFTQEPDINILTEGTHWLRVDTALFTYSRVVKPIQLNNFNCLSKDGIVINLNIKFQYQIKQEDLIDVFFEFGEEEQLIRHMTDIAKDSLRDTCGKFEATDFPNRRSEIQTRLETQLAADFIKSNAHTLVQFLQLENYGFPDVLNDAIDDKQRALQDKDKALQEREGQLTLAETVRLTAEVEAKKTRIQGDAEALSIILEANTTANAVDELWDSRRITFKLIQDVLGMTAPEFVWDYLSAEILGNSQNVLSGL